MNAGPTDMTSDRGARTSERGGIVIGWLVRLLVLIAIVALCAYEGGAVIVAHVQSDTDATDVSEAAAIAYGHSHVVEQARAAAEEKAKNEGATLVGFSVDAAHKLVTVTVEKKARTLLLHRLSFTKKWAVADTTRSQQVPD